MTACVAGSTAIDPALVRRFTEALERLNPDCGKLGLAVSGGPDSMAMLLLAQEAIPGGFEVATVDHGLRPEAKDECALVVAACEARGVPCEVLRVTVREGNVQAKAREARYQALYQWSDNKCLSAIATAHHIDDQAETLLMRLNKGSGVRGLAGVRDSNYPFEFRYEVPVIRPLLDFRRSELRQVLSLKVADDPSNRDQRFDRVRIRQAISNVDWLDPVALARSASNLGDAERALIYLTNKCYGEFVEHFEQRAVIKPPPERELARRLVERVIAHLGDAPRGGDVARLADRLARGENGNLGGVLATVEGDQWVFRPEPPRRTG